MQPTADANAFQLEEALLRTESINFCIINQGAPPAVVMGISGKPEELLHTKRVKKTNIPVIKRFSGGGTVIIDHDTLLITFIMGKKDVPIHAFPEPILQWSAKLYQESWKIPYFQLIENDYCIGHQKCGGNAQYIQKDRWLHHTSFLWDYSDTYMNLLKMPEKKPKYRENRSHVEFLTRLKDHAPNYHDLIESLVQQLSKRANIVNFNFKTWEEKPHRKSTEKIILY